MKKMQDFEVGDIVRMKTGSGRSRCYRVICPGKQWIEVKLCSTSTIVKPKLVHRDEIELRWPW